jgi:hypothetical protein
VRRRGTWLLVAALAGIGLAATADALRGEKDTPSPAARQATTGPEKNTTEEAPAAATPASAGSIEAPRIGRLSRIVEGVQFSFRVPNLGWTPGPIERQPDGSGFRNGRLYISQDTVGPQGAEAIVFWTSFPDGDHADPCSRLLSPRVGPSAADLAAAVATAPGTDLVTGPSDLTVGRRPAKHVVLTVRDDVGCDPGFFYTWHDEMRGPFWPGTSVGDTVRVWIVAVGGTRLFIEAETTKQADPALEREIQQIVESIRFDKPTAQRE